MVSIEEVLIPCESCFFKSQYSWSKWPKWSRSSVSNAFFAFSTKKAPPREKRLRPRTKKRCPQKLPTSGSGACLFCYGTKEIKESHAPELPNPQTLRLSAIPRLGVAHSRYWKRGLGGPGPQMQREEVQYKAAYAPQTTQEVRTRQNTGNSLS